MLQLFHMDIAKVDQDVAHVAMAIHAYCKSLFKNISFVFRRMLQVFYLHVVKVDLDVSYPCMLQVYISSVSYVCCKCFIWMLHMFAMATHVFSSFF